MGNLIYREPCFIIVVSSIWIIRYET
jgi:hypothetical protein